MPSQLEDLIAYLPDLVTELRGYDGRPPERPAEDVFSGAVLFVDVSGFTSLAEGLTRQGLSGVEVLSNVLNVLLDWLINLIVQHGGDIIEFAGDALLAVWPARDEDLATVTRRAAYCGQEMALPSGYPVSEGVRVFVKVTVTAGELRAQHVGGFQQRWRFLVSGPAVAQVKTAEEHVLRSRVLVSPEAWELLRPHGLGTPVAGGHILLNDLNAPLPLRPRERELGGFDDEFVRAYLPEPVLFHLEGGGATWLAEIRRVTVLFVNVRGLQEAPGLEQLQKATLSIQAVLSQYGGVLEEVATGDTGTVVLVGFGLPPLTQQDDAERAVRAALEIRDALETLGLHSGIGIATGRIFCGPAGNARRKEYVLSGDTPNLAARLMQNAPDETILVDEGTFQATLGGVWLERLPAFLLKGKSVPQTVYRVGDRTGSRRGMFGRDVERAKVRDKLQSLRQGSRGTLIIEGEPGIGKSRLVQDLLEQAAALGVRHLSGAATAMQSAPYFAWRPVLQRVLRLEQLGVTEARSRFLSEIQSDEEISRLAPLLNRVLPFELPDNDLTAQMAGDVRASNTENLLAQLLEKEASAATVVVVLEDCHWLDEASWALAQRVGRELQGLLLVLVTRPLPEPRPRGFLEILNFEGSELLHLTALDLEDAARLISDRLGAVEVEETIAAFVHQRGEGNPFFMEELVYALRDAGQIVMADGRGKVVPGQSVPTTVPQTLEAVITSRFDLLTSAQQLALKVASVIGRSFNLRLLRAAYPWEQDRAALGDHLDAMVRLEIIIPESNERDASYAFRHVITQQVVYNLMLPTQRREVHQAIAQWYESAHSDDLSSHYAVLAHHWDRAEKHQEAMEYLDKAGQQAALNFDNEGAINFLSRAVALNDEAETAADPVQQAKWHRQLGQAYLATGRLSASGEHLKLSLRLLGWPMPESKKPPLPSLLNELIVQLLHRALPAAFMGRDARQSQQLIEAAGAYESLAQVFYHNADKLRTFYSGLRSLNLAEKAVPSGQLARGYANMSIGAGFISQHGLARTYIRLALTRAEESGDLASEAMVLRRTALYEAGTGNWDQAKAGFSRSIEKADQIRDQRGRSEAMALLGLVAYLQADFRRALELLETVYAESALRGDPQGQVWALSWQSQALLRLGRTKEATARLDSALASDPHAYAGDLANIHAVRALAHLCEGEYAVALQRAQMALDILSRSRPFLFAIFEGYMATTETLLTLWEAGLPDGEAADVPTGLGRLANAACQGLWVYARIFRFARPRAWLFRGQYYRISGKPLKARKSWDMTIAMAERLGMGYEIARAHCEIAKLLSPGDPEREKRLASAAEIFDDAGALYDSLRVRTLVADRQK